MLVLFQRNSTKKHYMKKAWMVSKDPAEIVPPWEIGKDSVLRRFLNRSIKIKMMVAVVITTVLLILGGSMFTLIEKWVFMDGLYFTAQTVSTIGFGDITAKTSIGRLLVITFAFFGMAVLSFLIITIQESSTEGTRRTFEQKKKELQRIVNTNGAEDERTYGTLENHWYVTMQDSHKLSTFTAPSTIHKEINNVVN
eukprot:TRINITY_DN3775_c0_g1_i2.p2 TRINITY_DN3775_c0_g1~~TRINITY_DN3775_c0_g1_i2.p2  ORF type:complete len:196 (+),score=31.03 TRINITY_DN3775_c0_g1_i2:923-1510(+)